MAATLGDSSATLDDLDRQIIHCIQRHCRAPFALIGEVVGVSEQTVARRFRRLESTGVVRVLGLVTPQTAGYETWILRIRCRPAAAGNLAEALARRSDVSWVSISAGGSEVLCTSRTRRDVDNRDLLLQRLPRTAEVQTLDAYAVLHHFDPSNEWQGFAPPLSERQAALLGRTNRPPTGEARVSDADAPLLAGLARNGRASLAQLARSTGWSPARVSRRIDQLTESGAIYFDVDLNVERLGFTALANLWLTVPPGELEAIGAALVEHDEVAFCAAVTGSANLTASVVCRNQAELYRYVSTKVGALTAVRALEISPLLRRVKQAGSILTATGIARA